MGRIPHPVHVIAEVNGRRRPLGAVDIGFGDPDYNMIEVCNWLITILQDPGNRAYLELEVDYAKKLSEEVWSQDLEEELKPLRHELYKLPMGAESCSKLEELEARIMMPMFPAIETCLYLGAVWKGYGDYLHNVGPRPWNSAFDWEGRCMPGSLILDITDPSRVAYCFLLPIAGDWFYEEEDTKARARYEERRMIPLSGFEWLAAFDLDRKDATVSGAKDSKPAPLIDTQSLHEAWPSFPKPDDILDEDDPDVEIIQNLVYCKSIKEGKMTLNKATRVFKYKLKKYLYNHPEELTTETPLAVQLLLAVLKPKKQAVTRLRLHKFVNLSGDQIIQLVDGLRPHKRVKNALTLLDVSFNRDLAVEHLYQILDIISVHELIFWDNPNLPLKDITELVHSIGGIKKLTARGHFMEAFERWLIPGTSRRHFVALAEASAAIPARSPIKQLVWVNAMTQRTDDSTTMGADPPAMMCLEKCDVQELAEILEPKGTRIRRHHDSNNFTFAEALTFPLRDSWTTLAEFFTSCRRIEEFIASCNGRNFGIHDSIGKYPLQVPLMIATGNPNSKTAISPFPAEAFERAEREVNRGHYERKLRTTSPGPILLGEYTMMMVHERDIDRLSYGIVTRNAKGTIEIYDPEAMAKSLGDADATRAWRTGIGKLPKWTEEEQEERNRKKTEERKERRKELREKRKELKSKTEEKDCHDKVKGDINMLEARHEKWTNFLHRRAMLLGVDSAEKIYDASILLADKYKHRDNDSDW